MREKQTRRATLPRLARASLAYGARWTGALRRRETAQRGGLLVLAYPRILPDELLPSCAMPSLALSLSTFQRQLRWLTSRYQVLPLGPALERLHAGIARSHRRVAALTFDDGHWDNHAYVAPVLEACGASGTFFVPAAFPSGAPLWIDQVARAVSQGLWWRTYRRLAGCLEVPESLRDAAPQVRTDWVLRALQDLDPATREALVAELVIEGNPMGPEGIDRPMSWEEVRSLPSRGHEIGASGVTREPLIHFSFQGLERELRTSKQELERRTGCLVRGISYPDGAYSAQVIEAVRAAGYEYGCTTEPGVHGASGDRYAVERVVIDPARLTGWRTAFDLTVFRAEVCGLRGELRAFAPRRPARPPVPASTQVSLEPVAQ